MRRSTRGRSQRRCRRPATRRRYAYRATRGARPWSGVGPGSVRARWARRARWLGGRGGLLGGGEPGRIHGVGRFVARPGREVRWIDHVGERRGREHGRQVELGLHGHVGVRVGEGEQLVGQVRQAPEPGRGRGGCTRPEDADGGDDARVDADRHAPSGERVELAREQAGGTRPVLELVGRYQPGCRTRGRCGERRCEGHRHRTGCRDVGVGERRGVRGHHGALDHELGAETDDRRRGQLGERRARHRERHDGRSARGEAARLALAERDGRGRDARALLGLDQPVVELGFVVDRRGGAHEANDAGRERLAGRVLDLDGDRHRRSERNGGVDRRRDADSQSAFLVIDGLPGSGLHCVGARRTAIGTRETEHGLQAGGRIDSRIRCERRSGDTRQCGDHEAREPQSRATARASGGGVGALMRRVRLGLHARDSTAWDRGIRSASTV